MKRKLLYLLSVLVLSLICVYGINFKSTYAKTYPKNGYGLGTTATVKVKTYLRSTYNKNAAKLFAVKRGATINLLGDVWYDVANDIHWSLAYDLDSKIIGFINLNHVKNIKEKSDKSWNSINTLTEIATLASTNNIDLSGLSIKEKGDSPRKGLDEIYLDYIRDINLLEQATNFVALM